MKIKYRWFEEPDKIKIFNTVTAFRKNPLIFTNKWNDTQEKYDKMTLKSFEEKLNQGLVLEYSIVKERIK